MITKRIWKSGPRRIKRVAWGFTAQRNGKQVRRVREEWTKEDAERAFSEWTIEGVTPATDTVAAPAGMTFGAMVEKFLAKKKSEGKRSIQDDEERSVPLLAFFGKATPLAAIRTRRVAEYRMARRATTSRLGRPLAPATVNREVALLRSILRMALAWDELERVPVFEMTKEQGKQRHLALDEDHPAVRAGAADEERQGQGRADQSGRIRRAGASEGGCRRLGRIGAGVGRPARHRHPVPHGAHPGEDPRPGSRSCRRSSVTAASRPRRSTSTWPPTTSPARQRCSRASGRKSTHSQRTEPKPRLSSRPVYRKSAG